jgi:hypothetical protein
MCYGRDVMHGAWAVMISILHGTPLPDSPLHPAEPEPVCLICTDICYIGPVTKYKTSLLKREFYNADVIHKVGRDC